MSKLILLLLGLAAFLSCSPPAGDTQSNFVASRARLRGTPYDVAIFILDDVAKADLALYGGPVAMPYLEQLAAAGVRFDNAYAHAWCAPTRRSLQFGRWWQNGNGGACQDAPTPSTPTIADTSLAEALPNHSAAVIGKWHLGGTPFAGPWAVAPLVHGYSGGWYGGVPGNVGFVGCGSSSDPDYFDWVEVNATSLTTFSSSISTLYHPTVVRDYFRSGWPAAPRPTLTVVSSNLPHVPFHVPPANLLPLGYQTPNTARGKYEAMLRAMDTTLGQMLTVVNLETTLIVVIGDNGTPPQAAPSGLTTRSKGTTFERGVRVPLIVAGGPTVNGGRVSSVLVHAIDVYATVIEAGGGTVPQGSDAHSFLGVLTQSAFTPRQFVFLGDRWMDLNDLPGDRAVVSAGGFKLRQIDSNGDGTVDSEQLYDLLLDPGETTNIVASSTEDDALRAWLVAEAP